MVIPKFDIGDTVYVYEAGKLKSRVVCKIQVLITEDEFKVGYQFIEPIEDPILRSLRMDRYKDECEVFRSLDEFIKINQDTHE